MGMLATILEFYGRDTEVRDHFRNVKSVVVLAFFVSAVEKMLVLNQIPDLYIRKESMSVSSSNTIMIKIIK